MGDGSIKCPGCGADLHAIATAAFKPEILKVAYKMEPGRKMPVEDFCKSLGALAESLKLVSNEVGQPVLVSLEALSVSDGEVSASVAVTAIPK